MKRALVVVSVAWLSGACSSDVEGGQGMAASGAPGGPEAPIDPGAAGAAPAGADPGAPGLPALEVVSISPEDAASEVPLDAVIEMRFSAAVDPATASDTSVVVSGPNGPLSGTLTVAGDLVRFAPASPLPLLTPVRVSLAAGLASSEGRTLAQPVEAQFQSRDGAFGEPRQIDVGAAASLFLRGNDAGDLIATWTDLQVTSSVEAMVFDAELGTWTPAQRIENDDQLAFSQPVAAVGPNGDSIVTWRGGGFARYAGGWSPATVAEGLALPSVALGAGRALGVANGMAGASYQFLLDGSNDWSEAQSLLMGGRVDAIEAFAGGFIALGSRDGELIASELSEPAASWSEFTSLASIERLERLRLTTHADVAAVAWVDRRQGPPSETEELALVARPAARVFAEGAWSPPIELPEGADLPWVSLAAGGRALAVWTQADAVSASSFSSDQGWTVPEQLAEQSQLAPSGGVDGAGNLMALWPASEQIAVQRRAEGGEWQALEPLDSQVTVALWSHVDRQGRVSVVWQNANGIWWARFE